MTTRTPPRTTRHAGQRGSATQNIRGESEVDDRRQEGFVPSTRSTWFPDKGQGSTVSPHDNDIDGRSTPASKKSYKKEDDERAETADAGHGKYGKKGAASGEEDESTFSARKEKVEDGDNDGAAVKKTARVESHDRGAVEHRVVIAGGDDSRETNYDDKRNVSTHTCMTVYISRVTRGCNNAGSILFDYVVLDNECIIRNKLSQAIYAGYNPRGDLLLKLKIYIVTLLMQISAYEWIWHPNVHYGDKVIDMREMFYAKLTSWQS